MRAEHQKGSRHILKNTNRAHEDTPAAPALLLYSAWIVPSPLLPQHPKRTAAPLFCPASWHAKSWTYSCRKQCRSSAGCPWVPSEVRPLSWQTSFFGHKGLATHCTHHGSSHSRYPLPGHARMKEPIMAIHGVKLCTLPSPVSWTCAAAPALLAHPLALPWNLSSEPLPLQTPRCRRTSRFRIQYACMPDYDVRIAIRALHTSLNVLMQIVLHALPRGDLAEWRLDDCVTGRKRSACGMLSPPTVFSVGIHASIWVAQAVGMQVHWRP